MEEGQVIQIEAKTNPGQRESLQKWIDSQTLELIVTNCHLLYQNGSNIGNLTEQQNHVSPNLPSLSLDNIFIESSVSIELVDSIEAVQRFSNDMKQQLCRIDETRSELVGIDCEWRPSEYMDKPRQPQPVLLLQICLHSLKKVYLFDLQTMLRPLLSPEATMNDLEEAVNDSLIPLMTSTDIIKTGYQLSSDLRRMAASYPHIPCFCEVNSVLEVASLIKRVLHVSKQKRTRYITMSLAAMSSHYLGMTVNKEDQLCDWSTRPLAQSQVKYAALDAAVSPVLVEKALESISGCIVRHDHKDKQDNEFGRSVIERWDGDPAFLKEILSWRFYNLESPDSSKISELQAKQIVGSSWQVASSWITGESPPSFEV
jgi:hypothetical protein